MDILNRAFSDSFRHVGRLPAVVITIGGALAGWLFLGVLAGRRVMDGEINFVVAAILGVVCVWLAIFVYNLAASPFRIQKDRAEALAGALSEAEAGTVVLNERIAHLEAGTQLKLSFGNIIFGGEIGPRRRLLAPVVRIANIGAMPSIAEDFQMFVVLPSGVPQQVQIAYIPNLKIGLANGSEAAIPREELIFTKGAEPIPVGGVIGGYLTGIVDTTGYAEDSLVGCRVRVQCRDARGGSYSYEQGLDDAPSDVPNFDQFVGTVFKRDES